MKVYLTAKDTDKRLSRVEDIEFDKNASETEAVNIYDDISFQKVTGFGGAFTESFCYSLSKMSEENQNKVLEAYFGENGICYSVTRTHMGSCDFSIEHYECIENGDMNTFQIDRDKKWIIPTIKKAMELSKNPLKLLISPWSPPAAFKSNKERNHGGKLLDDFKKSWAEHYVKFIDLYKKEGIDIWALSVQNEPAATQTWDSCVYTAKEEGEFVRDYLAPKLEESDYKDTLLFVWDHNKVNAYDRARETLKEADEQVDGIGVHWYGGDHFEALSYLNKKYPDKELVFTEGCQEGAEYIGNWCVGERYAHDIIGNFNNYVTAFIDWNLALDENGGPNHVGNFCCAPIILDTKNNEVIFENSYYYIGHFSKFVMPGAVRIGATKYTDRLDTVAFKNPNGEIVLIVLNREEKKMPINILKDGKKAEFQMPSRSIATFII